MQFQLSDIIQNPKLLADVSEHDLDHLIQLHPAVALFRLEKYKKNKNDAQLAQTSFYLANRNILYQLDYSNKETSLVEEIRTDANNESDNILAQIDDIAVTNKEEVVYTIATTEEPAKSEVIQQNVHQEFDHTKSTSNFNELHEIVPLPSNSTKIVAEVLRTTDNTKLDDSDKNAHWATIVAEGQDHVTFGDAFEQTLEDPDAE